jgi:hypothetical protein
MFPAVVVAVLLGPVAMALGEAVDRGGAALAGFGLLMIPAGYLVRVAAIQLEGLALGIRQRPWLRGRLTRSQKLILPFSTANVVTYGLSCGFSGGIYLLTATPGWSPLNVVALGFVAVSGLLLGFGISRLIVGMLIIHYSGLWAAPRRAWLIGGTVVAVASVAHAIYSVETTMQIVPGI